MPAVQDGVRATRTGRLVQGRVVVMNSARWLSLPARAFRKARRVAGLRSALNTQGAWEALEESLGPGCVVLMYHHVGPYRRGTYRHLNVSARQFERHMRWLARHGYTGIRPSQWLEWLNNEAPLPAKPMIVSFDDAYADIAEFALPVLHHYGLGGCVFVATRSMGKTNAWDEANGCGTLEVMSAEQIQYWAGKGIEFGAHSRTHADLTLLSRERLRDEVAGSRQDLESLLAVPVTSFAYPYGACSAETHALVQSHFGLAFGIDEGVNFRGDDPHLLKRIYVGPTDSVYEFGMSVRWGGREPAHDPRMQRKSMFQCESTMAQNSSLRDELRE
jgi:peptidoglycan/xylan/chitin deacetylase (PgdA/CDA1 family)